MFTNKIKYNKNSGWISAINVCFTTTVRIYFDVTAYIVVSARRVYKYLK